MYAAYHPALSLARLTDQCPEFAHHLFGISSVSGGSLGAAVFAELVRTLPTAAPNDPASPSGRCTPTAGPTVDNVLQTKVQDFFNTDFLSPVIATAFISTYRASSCPSCGLVRIGRGLSNSRSRRHGANSACLVAAPIVSQAIFWSGGNQPALRLLFSCRRPASIRDPGPRFAGRLVLQPREHGAIQAGGKYRQSGARRAQSRSSANGSRPAGAPG